MIQQTRRASISDVSKPIFQVNTSKYSFENMIFQYNIRTLFASLQTQNLYIFSNIQCNFRILENIVEF